MNLKNKENTLPYISTEDYSVSRENFNLILNKELNLLYTDPVPDQLEKYYESEEYISHTDRSDGLINKLYQIAKKFALGRKLKLINNLKTKTKKILDLGCGTGDFLQVCKKNNWEIIGVEPNGKARQKAKEKAIVPHKSIQEIKNKKFNVITLWHVLEHIPDLNHTLSKINSLLEKNGYLIIAVPNYRSYDAKHYGKFWAAYDVPRHLWHFSKKSINIISKEHDMELIKTKPMLLDSFYVSLLSEKYKKGKSNLIKAFYIGLLSNLRGLTSKEYSSHIYILKKR